MLLPPVHRRRPDARSTGSGEEITERLFMPNEFMRVDADYSAKPYEEWRAADWPRTYQSPAYENIFAAGIAFAPPHRSHGRARAPSGAAIAPAPPRTGMPSAMIGESGRAQHRRHDRRRRRPDQDGFDGGDGRRLRRLRRREPLHRHRRLDDRVPDRPRLGALPGVRPRHDAHLRRDRPGRALDQDPAPPHVPLQGTAPAGLVA